MDTETENDRCPVDKFINKLLTRPGAAAISSNPVKRSRKIITMTTQHNITFKDTLLDMSCALKKLPKCICITRDLAKAECTKYCVQDVDILRKSFEMFRKMFMDMFRIDGLTECCTIASLCFRIFKTHFMKPHTIAHIGRESSKHYSFEGIRWLVFMEKYTGQFVAHARNGGERVFKLRNK
ncbi:hypothetical protein Avbf_05019 [Armadillidium vulgare]|nr:hypothetical protein Avbf_05019 [Armadillidium vulgare]